MKNNVTKLMKQPPIKEAATAKTGQSSRKGMLLLRRRSGTDAHLNEKTQVLESKYELNLPG